MSADPPIRAALVRQADAVATIIAIASGSYGVLLGVLYEPFGSAELFTFESARWSAWLNIAAAINAGAFMTTHRVARRNAERRGRDPQRAFERVIFWALCVSMLISVAHVYIGGSQNTILPLSGIVIAALATWFLPWRPVLTLSAVWLVGYAVVLGLEVSGVAPYAPIFRDAAALETIFLDWRSLAGTASLVIMLFGSMMLLLRQFHEPLHAARAAVEEEVEARTEALRAARDDLDRQLDQLEASPAEQRVRAAEQRAHRTRVEQRLVLRAAALRCDHIADRLDRGIEALRRLPRASALGVDDLAAAAIELRGRPVPPSHDATPVDFDTLARDIVALLRADAAAAGVRTQLELGRTPAVDADRGALEDALFAVMDNALRAVADQRSKRIILRTRVEPRTVLIEVHDTGGGLPNEDVFAVGVGRWGRAGLGLAVARDVMRVHGGTVTGGPSPHGGAVVRLSLPRAATTGPIQAIGRG